MGETEGEQVGVERRGVSWCTGRRSREGVVESLAKGRAWGSAAEGRLECVGRRLYSKANTLCT